MITHLSCPKEAENGTGNIEERLATYHSFICPKDKAEQSAPESEVPVDFISKERIHTFKFSPHFLLDTKISKTYDLIQYWQHYMTGHSFKCSCFNVSISSIMHLFFSMSFQKRKEAEGALFDLRIKAKPTYWRRIQNILQKLTHETIRRIGECTSRNPKLNHVQGRTLMCFVQFKENPPDICLQTPRLWIYGTYLESQIRMKPNLLSLGTCQAVLRTRSVQIMECDAVTQPIFYWKQDYENITTIRQQGWAPEILIRASDTEFEHEHNKSDYADITLCSLSKETTAGMETSWKSTRTIQRWEKDQRYKPPNWDQTKQQTLGFFFLIKEKPPDWQNHQPSFEEFRQEATMQAEIIGGCIKGNAELSHIQEKILMCFIQLKENPPDICRQKPKQWTYGNYLDSQNRMKPDMLPLATGQMIIRTKTVQRMEHDVVNKLSLSWKQEYKNRKATKEHRWTPTILVQTREKEFEYAKGIKTTLKRKRRIQKWEDDQRFKPPDLDQNKRENFGFFILIKEEPPDATHKPKPRLLLVRDKSDLRTNLFQLGGDDMNLTDNKETEEELEAEEDLRDDYGSVKTMEMPTGQITRAKAKQLNRLVAGMLKHNQEGNSQVHNALVSFQACEEV